MNRRSIVVTAVVAAVLAAAAGTIASVAKAGPATAKRQRVAISASGGDTRPFVLSPLSQGVVGGDSGTASFSGWTTGHIRRNGVRLETGDGEMILDGKQGTIVTRNRIVWMTVPNGASIFTGTWKVVRATGAYAGLNGSGVAAGVMQSSKETDARFTGLVSTKK